MIDFTFQMVNDPFICSKIPTALNPKAK